VKHAENSQRDTKQKTRIFAVHHHGNKKKLQGKFAQSTSHRPWHSSLAIDSTAGGFRHVFHAFGSKLQNSENKQTKK
jgi:hypothetical protein